MAIDFDERTVYAKLTYDKKEGKKKTFFGGYWGALKKSEANTIAYLTGNGLVVLDIDTQDLSEIDKGIRKEVEKLGPPTVTTARGFHWYFEHKNSPEFINKASYSKLVDVRSDGGIVFAQYIGKDKNISYKRTGKVYKKIPKKLHTLLKDAMHTSRTKVKQRSQWAEIPKGEIHDGTLRYIMKDFHNGLAYDEVIANGLDYVQRYLGGTQREINLMMERVKWGFEKRLESKLEEQKPVPANTPSEIGGEFDEDEVLSLLLAAQNEGALELERVKKEIKGKLKISMATLDEMLKEARLSKAGGISTHFKGDIVWDSDLGLFVEVRDTVEKYYKKSDFNQTVMSKSGFLENADVNELLPTVPSKHVIYNPTEPRGDMKDENGDDAFNVYRPVTHRGKGKKIPKTIDRVLDNLFESDPKAKDEFVNWMAVILQTGIRTGVAWGFFGASGTGKGLISDIMRRLLGPKNCSMNVSDNDLQSAFSPYLYHVQFVQLNEVASDFHGRHGVAGHIKAFVGDPYIRVNMKYMGEVEVANYCNVILNSNKSNPIELDVDDRRWNMIVTDTSLTKRAWWKGDDSYQKALGEVEEFGAFLLKYDADVTRARTPMPISKAKQGVIDQTTPVLVQMGHMIRAGNLEGIVDMLEVDEHSLGFSLEELSWAVDNSKWSNDLLKRIYLWAVGDRELKGNEVKRYFVAPYVSKETAVFRVNGDLVRGVTLL